VGLVCGGATALRLDNPISTDLDCMRPSLLPNLLDAARRNADGGRSAGALFEVGPVFRPEAAAIEPDGQLQAAGGIRWGMTPRHWRERPRPVDALDAKADALAALVTVAAPVDKLRTTADAPAWFHPGRSGSLRLGAVVLAVFGELHPRMLAAFGAAGPMAAFEVFSDAVPVP
ncbi:MAG: phenylalanine--tRNA ligase subunit beta, partial [Alphaproteobacteria bacterium]|nr:phenylalanine--tRNA ligase subunit beta [Alphaproteobacteria bacterium]